MSHFTSITTRFQNLFYLKTALQRLQIPYQTNKISSDFSSYNESIVVPQPNGYDISFSWNGQEYELTVDMSFWGQPYSIENFLDKVAQEYASELIVGESKKLGFKPSLYQQNSDGSTRLVLERWNKTKSN